MLMEALQLLKFSLKKERLSFTAGWSTSESVMDGVSQPKLKSDILDDLISKREVMMDKILQELTIYDS